MKAIETTGYTLLGLFILLVVLFIFIKMFVSIYDRKAKRLVKTYCKNNNYTYKKVTLHPNQYGLHFSTPNGHFYAPFYLSDNEIVWTRGLPQEIISRQLTQGPFNTINKPKSTEDNDLKSVG